jgi:hypothetical protein
MKKSKRKSRGAFKIMGLMVLGFLPLGLLSMGCATTGGVPVPDSMTVSRAEAQWPGTTLADLRQGRSEYVQNCAACHDLHDASDLSPTQWEKVMVRMQKKAKIDDVTKDSILHYLLASTLKQDGAVD